jgi:Ca2+-binding EF-hand superfamily protein
MTLLDWFSCIDYEQHQSTEQLIKIAHNLKLQLDREEIDLLLNFSAEDLNPLLEEHDFIEMCEKSGLRVE